MSGINDMTTNKINNTLSALEFMRAYWCSNFQRYVTEPTYSVWRAMLPEYATNHNRNRVYKLLKIAIIDDAINSTSCSKVMKYVNRSDWWVINDFKRNGPTLEMLDRVMDRAIGYGQSIRGECFAKENIASKKNKQ